MAGKPTRKAARKAARTAPQKSAKKSARKPAPKAAAKRTRAKAGAQKTAPKARKTARPATRVPPYRNPGLSPARRAADLVSRMTVQEKMAQLLSNAPAIERLGVARYVWQCEALHGVARAGVATVFPQAIALAATWDPELHHKVAVAISDEARAKHHDAVRNGNVAMYLGLTFWSPNINIFRDPRWGRGHETYGEDPYLTARLGVAFVRGMQGDDPRYLKTVATPKHYAVHSGPEAERHGFDAVVSERDLRETYLPAFKACVREGGAWSVMGAYNRTNGEACCASPRLLDRILRDEWGFRGYVVSDCGALDDIWRSHHLAATRAEGAALALKRGCDLECGDAYSTLPEALALGHVSEEDITRSVTRLMEARIRLGMFDPPARVKWARIPLSVNDSPVHRALSRQAARESLVLLENRASTLPLRKDLRRILVTGPNAADVDVLVGNYNGTPSKPRTVLDGIRAAVSPSTEVVHLAGCGLLDMDQTPRDPIMARMGWRPPDYGPVRREGDIGPDVKDLSAFRDLVDVARASDVVVAVVGLSPEMEGEEGEAPERSSLGIPAVQEHMLRALGQAGRPVVVVLMGGSAMSSSWIRENASALLLAWYPGGEGGDAVADVLFGEENPAGRLPVTFYASVDQLPPFNDYRMAGRTYRYFQGRPLYPFGHGLSYTTFRYSALTLPDGAVPVGRVVPVRVTVENTGSRPGDEVAQLYLSNLGARVPVPIRTLVAFQRVRLEPGQKRVLRFSLSPEQLSVVTDDGRRVQEASVYRIVAGGTQPEFQDRGTSGPVQTASFRTEGAAREMEP